MRSWDVTAWGNCSSPSCGCPWRASPPFFGAAGHWSLRGRTTRLRVVGLASVAGVCGMEALLYGWHLHYATQAWACLSVSVLASLLARSNRERALVLAVAAAFSFLAYGVVVLPLQALSG
ncbi:DUF6518 family protein [Streptomyces sp. NPDC085937]|uniref:DUF6518 family protein n=1 Tax=Streptomyces sp. NPDC085937 TaxID=3365742 RepID=UPI0037D3C5BF